VQGGWQSGIAVHLLGTPWSQAALLPAQAVAALLAWLRLLQVLFIFPRYGPLLIMAIRMLEDLTQFLALAVFVMVSFGAAFYVLFSGAVTLLGDQDHELSFGYVIMRLLEGAMDGEPDRIMGIGQSEDREGIMGMVHAISFQSVSTFAWFMMAVFGMVVVLLLLNMLIARFAKTFDLVHEDLAGTFKVAFARVAIKGSGLQAIPAPFNLVRGLVLLLYTLIAIARARLQGVQGIQADESFTSLEEILHEGSVTLPEVGPKVVMFLRKATSPEAKLYPQAVEEWVKLHQYDFSRDERWRTGVAKQIGGVEAAISRLEVGMEAVQSSLQILNAEGEARRSKVARESRVWRDSRVSAAAVTG